MSRDRRIAGWFLALAITSAAYAVILFATGGFEAEVLGMRLRSRAWERPGIVAGVLLLLAYALAQRRRADEGASAWAAIDSASTAQALTALAIAWVLFAGFRYGTFVAGGADSFGYVSQAHLLAGGALVDEIPMRPEFAWRDASLSLIPLGYRPAARDGYMAPVYPPGLPMLMALVRPFGDRAMYAVVPLLGAVVLACAGMWGRRLADPLAGGMAAACLSVSASFLLMQFSPMSDVPVTAMWLGSFLCAMATFAGAPAVAGGLAALAVLTRPNLAPLAAIVAAMLATRGPSRLRVLVTFFAALTAGIVALLWIQWRRYGNPLASGYGSAGELFALAHVVPNVVSYVGRITALYTPIIWLFFASPVVLRKTQRRWIWAALALIAGVWLAYLPYLPFDAWFFTRFLLPAISLMLVLALIVVMTSIRTLPMWMRPAVTIVAFVVLVSVLAGESRRRGVFEAWRLEGKYADAGRYVDEHLPAAVYVLARQHSGSVRLYGHRPTIRWDVVGSDQLDLVVETVRAIGAQMYLVADEDEMPAFAQRFTSQSTPTRLRALAQFGHARVYAVE